MDRHVRRERGLTGLRALSGASTTLKSAAMASADTESGNSMGTWEAALAQSWNRLMHALVGNTSA
eukprot:5070408-Alexandrium_andersonii.AAC.1